MRKFMLFLVAAAVSVAAVAQRTDKQMATLQHGDKTSVYYGIDAFVQAYNDAADTLDVITLSSGEFNVPSKISKSIAVYGAGFEKEIITGTDRTYLNGSVTLVPADAVDGDGQTIKAAKRVNGVHLEGLCLKSLNVGSNNKTPIYNLTVVKCQMSSVTYDVDHYNNTIRQCVIYGRINNTSSMGYNGYVPFVQNFLVSNCWIGGENSYGFNFQSNSTIKVDHCVIIRGPIGTFNYTNNILYVSPGSGYTGSNNIFVGSGTPIQDDYGNWTSVPNAALWAAEGEDGSYAADKDFKLKYPAKYIGNDGTEIGLHGGTYAWNKIPSIPRITECTIDTKDAAKGTIKLSIKAEAQTTE